MTATEIDELALSLSRLDNYEVTNILFDEKAIQMSLSGIGKDGKNHFCWLCISLKPGVPYAFLGDSYVPRIAGLKKPLALFSKTHFKGLSLTSSIRNQELGRVLELSFEGVHEAYLRIYLFPGGQNIEARMGEKVLWAFKPKELTVPAADLGDIQIEEFRDPSRFQQNWQKKFVRGDQKKDPSKVTDLKKILKKKKSGLAKMSEKLDMAEDTVWPKLGEWLKNQIPLEDCPVEFLDYFNKDKDRAWNIKNCFAQAKKGQNKRQGTLERIQSLKEEIEKMESGQWSPAKSSGIPSLLLQADAQGRTHALGHGGRLFIGRSAKDNLSLLRKAKPWYLWLHIRDYTGAYGIIELQRKQGPLSQEILADASRKVLKQSLPSSAGGIYEVLIAECRYVRPLSKSKPGQVTYSHERVIRVEL